MGSWVFYGAALVSASCWALGSVLWRKLGDEISPVTMNLSKGVLGSLFLGGSALCTQAEPATTGAVGFLVLSGLIGIAVGDTLFFHALMHLGPRLTSLFGTLYPVSIALSAAVFLGERPSLMAWWGILVTTAGVGWVLWERSISGGGSKDRARGLSYALLALMSTTVAVLLAKVGVENMAPMQGALIRLLSGTVGLIGWGCVTRGLAGWLTPLRDWRLLARVARVVAVVVFGGFWLSLVALKNIDASVAGTLNATTPLFVLPFAGFFLKESVSARSIFGTLVSVAGVGLIFFG